MERKVEKILLEWKNSSDRFPLILQGARQVGKTFSDTTLLQKMNIYVVDFKDNAKLITIVFSLKIKINENLSR